jgi:uncharacterized protein YkwD
MARLLTAIATLLACTACALSVPVQALARTHHRGKAACTSARSSRRAHKKTKSYRGSHCPKGTHRAAGAVPGSGADLLVFTASDGHCRDAELPPTTDDVEQVRAATLCLVNRERTSRGETALRWNGRLVAAAQAHTESMAFGGYFQHVGPGDETPAARMRKAGYIYSPQIGYEVGENIAWGSLWLGDPKSIVSAWMASPGHRANILDAHFRETGIGVSPHLGTLAPGQSGGIYTQDFGVIIG